MAKTTFSKLGLTKNTVVNSFEYNGQVIEVKQYISINDKADLVADVLNYVLNNGENRYANPMWIEVYTAMGIINRYTNITFTDKQKEDIVKLYDYIKSSGLLDEIYSHMHTGEYNDVWKYVNTSIDAYYKYYNSVFGILDSINRDYSSMNYDATEIQKALADPNNMALLKDVLAKLG